MAPTQITESIRNSMQLLQSQSTLISLVEKITDGNELDALLRAYTPVLQAFLANPNLPSTTVFDVVSFIAREMRRFVQEKKEFSYSCYDEVAQAWMAQPAYQQFVSTDIHKTLTSWLTRHDVLRKVYGLSKNAEKAARKDSLTETEIERVLYGDSGLAELDYSCYLGFGKWLFAFWPQYLPKWRDAMLEAITSEEEEDEMKRAAYLYHYDQWTKQPQKDNTYEAT